MDALLYFGRDIADPGVVVRRIIPPCSPELSCQGDCTYWDPIMGLAGFARLAP